MLVGGGLRIVHVTLHESVATALARITPQLVCAATLAGVRACKALGVERPTVALFGINPHASEGGLFGHEDAERVVPAAQQLKAQGLDVVGPMGADMLLADRKHDLYVAMFHDQGHIPIKLLAPQAPAPSPSAPTCCWPAPATAARWTSPAPAPPVPTRCCAAARCWSRPASDRARHGLRHPHRRHRRALPLRARAERARRRAQEPASRCPTPAARASAATARARLRRAASNARRRPRRSSPASACSASACRSRTWRSRPPAGTGSTPRRARPTPPRCSATPLAAPDVNVLQLRLPRRPAREVPRGPVPAGDAARRQPALLLDGQPAARERHAAAAHPPRGRRPVHPAGAAAQVGRHAGGAAAVRRRGGAGRGRRRRWCAWPAAPASRRSSRCWTTS